MKKFVLTTIALSLVASTVFAEQPLTSYERKELQDRRLSNQIAKELCGNLSKVSTLVSQVSATKASSKTVSTGKVRQLIEALDAVNLQVAKSDSNVERDGLLAASKLCPNSVQAMNDESKKQIEQTISSAENVELLTRTPTPEELLENLSHQVTYAMSLWTVSTGSIVGVVMADSLVSAAGAASAVAAYTAMTVVVSGTLAGETLLMFDAASLDQRVAKNVMSSDLQKVIVDIAGRLDGTRKLEAKNREDLAKQLTNKQIDALLK